jgi:hypothetical protein
LECILEHLLLIIVEETNNDVDLSGRLLDAYAKQELDNTIAEQTDHHSVPLTKPTSVATIPNPPVDVLVGKIQHHPEWVVEPIDKATMGYNGCVNLIVMTQ